MDREVIHTRTVVTRYTLDAEEVRETIFGWVKDWARGHTRGYDPSGTWELDIATRDDGHLSFAVVTHRRVRLIEDVD